jgi:hypothetical protein
VRSPRDVGDDLVKRPGLGHLRQAAPLHGYVGAQGVQEVVRQVAELDAGR